MLMSNKHLNKAPQLWSESHARNPEQCSDLLLLQWAGHNPPIPEIPLLWERYLRPQEHRVMDTTAEELLSARAAEEEAEANAFDDELLEALSEGDTGPASPEVPNSRCLL